MKDISTAAMTIRDMEKVLRLRAAMAIDRSLRDDMLSGEGGMMKELGRWLRSTVLQRVGPCDGWREREEEWNEGTCAVAVVLC